MKAVTYIIAALNMIFMILLTYHCFFNSPAGHCSTLSV